MSNCFIEFFGENLGNKLTNFFNETDIKIKLKIIKDIESNINNFELKENDKDLLSKMIKDYKKLSLLGDVSYLLETIKNVDTNLYDLDNCNLSMDSIINLINYNGLDFNYHNLPLLIDRCIWGNTFKRKELDKPTNLSIGVINSIGYMIDYAALYDKNNNDEYYMIETIWKILIFIKHFEDMYYTGASFKQSFIFLHNIKEIMKYKIINTSIINDSVFTSTYTPKNIILGIEQ